MIDYDKVASEINKICDKDCWKNPKKDCPYYSVCQMKLNGNEVERTKEFESAMTTRYMELNRE